LVEADKRFDTASSPARVSRGTLKRSCWPSAKQKVLTDDGTKKGDKKKNGIAIAGFVLSLTGTALFFLGPIMLVCVPWGHCSH